jgi:hypothetical protein
VRVYEAGRLQRWTLDAASVEFDSHLYSQHDLVAVWAGSRVTLRTLGGGRRLDVVYEVDPAGHVVQFLGTAVVWQDGRPIAELLALPGTTAEPLYRWTWTCP